MVYDSTMGSAFLEKKKQEEDQTVYDKPKLIEQLRQQLPEALKYNYTDEDLFQRALSIRPEWKKLKWADPEDETFKPGFWTGVGIIKDQIWNAVTDWVPVTVARSIRGGGNPIADFAKHSFVEIISAISRQFLFPEDQAKLREKFETIGDIIEVGVSETKLSKGVDAWLDDFIKNNISEAEMYSELPVEFKDDTWINIPFFGKATYGDLEELGQNLGYSAAGMLAAIPGFFVGGNLGAIATSGAFLFRASKDQFVEDLLKTFINYYGEEKGIEEFEKWRPHLEDDVNLHAFWEAGPEAFSNILMIGISKSAAKPLFSIAEKTPFVKNFMNNTYARILVKAGNMAWKPAAMLGEELATETITEVKQSEIEANLDLPKGMPKLREEASDWLEAYNDIKTSVFLNTLILGAGTHAATKSSDALLNLLKQKKDEHEANVRNKQRKREVINKTKEFADESDIFDVGYVEEEKRVETKKEKVEKTEERKIEGKKSVYEKLSAGREYNPEDTEVKAIKGKSPGEKLFNYILQKGPEAIKEIDSMDEEQQYKVISVLGRYITTTDSKANLTSDKGRFDTKKVLSFVFKEAPKPKKQQAPKEGTVGVESDMAELAVPVEEANMADYLGQVWAEQVEQALSEIQSKDEFDQLVESEIRLQEGKDVLKSKIIEIKKALEDAGTLKEYVDDVNSLLKEVNEAKSEQQLGDIVEKIDGFQTEALLAKPKKGKKKAQQKGKVQEQVPTQEQAPTQKIQPEESAEVLVQKAKNILSEKLTKLTESFQKEGASEVNIDIANKLLEKVKNAKTQNDLKRVAKSINSLEKKLKPKKQTKKIIEKEEQKPVAKKEKEPVVKEEKFVEKEEEQIKEKELFKGKKPTDFETAKKITIEKLKTFRESLKTARILSKNAHLVNSLSKDLVKAKNIDELRAIYKAINDFEKKKAEPVKSTAKTVGSIKTTKATRITNVDFKNSKAIVKEKLNNVKKALIEDGTFNKHRGFLSNALKSIGQAKSIDDLRKIYRRISYFEKKYSVKAEPVKIKKYTINDKKFEQAKKLTKEKVTELKKTLEQSGTLKENADFIISILDRLDEATNIEELRAIYRELTTFTKRSRRDLVRKTKEAEKAEKEKEEGTEELKHNIIYSFEPATLRESGYPASRRSLVEATGGEAVESALREIIATAINVLAYNPDDKFMLSEIERFFKQYENVMNGLDYFGKPDTILPLSEKGKRQARANIKELKRRLNIVLSGKLKEEVENKTNDPFPLPKPLDTKTREETKSDNEFDDGGVRFQEVPDKDRFGFVRENREIAQEIIDRIRKLYPSIKLESVARIFDKYGREVAGRAFRNIAQWSERYATLDTLAHEPWHIILEAFRDDPLIKLGLKKILFTTIPQFTMQHKTNHAHAYGLLIRDNKQLIKALKDRYDKLSKEEKSLRDKLDPDERFAKYAYPLSLYREAYEAATNTGSAKTFFDTMGVPTDEYNQQFLEDLAIELFTIEIGNYFAGRIQNNTLANRIKIWLKQFALRLKKIFSDLTADDIIQIVGERYFHGKYALSEDQINSTEEFYEEAVEEDIGDTEEEAVDTKDSNPLIRGGRFFINRLGIYIETSQLLGIARLAKESDNYDSFISAMLDYITQETGVQFKKKDEDIVITHPDGRVFKYNWNAFRNDQIEFFQKVNSLQERFDPKESPDGKLLTQMMITMSGGSVVSIDEPILPKKEGGVFKSITGETLPERERMSIVDYEAKQGRMQRLIIQSIKEIYKKVIPRKNPDKWFIRKIDGSDFTFNSHWINTINKKFGDKFLSGILKNNIFFLGELGDDNSHLIFAFVPHEYEYAGKDEFKKYFFNEIKEGRLDETHVDNFREWAEEQKNDPTIYAKLIGYHEVWKSMLGNNYMEYIDKIGLAKVYKYLKLSVSGKGTHVKGSGPARFMIYDPKEVTMEVNGEPVTLLKDDGGYAFDGAQIASGRYLKRLSENNGRLSAILKNVVSYLSPEKTDYVAIKTLTITAVPGTKLYKDGKLIAELRGSGKETYWYDTINNREFDYLVTMDEVKMATGKFANLYEVHEIPEYATRILIHPGASKKNAVHPLLVADLLADVKFMKDEYAAKFFEELYKHYDNLGIQYVKKFKDLFSNPQELANFILTDLQEGELPTEIHRAASINPKTLLLDHYRSQIMQMVVNNLFADGLFKGRSLKNKGTRLYLKPRFHLKFKDSESIHVSADNKTIYKMLKDASGYHDVDAINTWLEKNDFWVLIHRQPLQGSTKAQLRKIQSIVQGFHGDAIFMSDHDVFRINEADFDGDSVAIEKLNDALEEAWVNLQNSEAFKKRNKYVYTEIFKIDKKPTSLSNYDDVMTHLNDNNKSRGSQGLMVNAKTILSILALKQFKLELEDGSEISVYNLDDPVIMTDFPLDPDKLTPEMIQKLKDQGDDVYTRYDDEYIPLDKLPKGEKPDGYYLYTTKENEFSILLQFAVDNSKLRLLKRIRTRTLHEYVLSRMFRGKNLRAMRAVYRIFNYSDILRMKNEKGRTATDYEIKEMSKNLYLRYYDENGNRLPSSEIAKNILLELLEHTDDAKAVSVNDNVSPREYLITQVYKILGDDSVYDLIQPHEFYAVHGYAREKLNEKYYFELRKKMTPEQFNDVIDLTDKMNQERHRISDEAAKEKNRLAVEQNADTPGQIKYDYNRAFEPFIREFYDKLQAMTKEQRMLSTLYYLNGAKMINQKGVAVNQERVNYLLPILLMDETILSDYAEFYKIGMDKVRNNELNFNDYKKSAKQTYFRKMTQEGRNGRYC